MLVLLVLVLVLLVLVLLLLQWRNGGQNVKTGQNGWNGGKCTLDPAASGAGGARVTVDSYAWFYTWTAPENVGA